MSIAVTTVRAHPDKDLDTVVAFLTQYIDKRAPMPSVKVASVMQTRPTKLQKTSINYDTVKGKIKLKKYSREEYDLMLMAQHQQLYELWKKAGLIKGKKTPESSRALETTVAALEAKTNNSSNESCSQMKSSKLITETIKPLTERK